MLRPETPKPDAFVFKMALPTDHTFILTRGAVSAMWRRRRPRVVRSEAITSFRSPQCCCASRGASGNIVGPAKWLGSERSTLISVRLHPEPLLLSPPPCQSSPSFYIVCRVWVSLGRFILRSRYLTGNNNNNSTNNRVVDWWLATTTTAPTVELLTDDWQQQQQHQQ